jgi:hypothetical protein
VRGFFIYMERSIIETIEERCSLPRKEFITGKEHNCG